MDFGLTVGGAGAVGTDGGAGRAVGFGGAGIAVGGFDGAIGAGAAGRRTATIAAGRGGGATFAAAGGAICRVAVPPGILPAGKFKLERGIVRGGGANSPPRAPPATGAGRRAMTGLVGIRAVVR